MPAAFKGALANKIPGIWKVDLSGKPCITIAEELAKARSPARSCIPGEDPSCPRLPHSPPAAWPVEAQPARVSPSCGRRAAKTGMDEGSPLLGDGDPQHNPSDVHPVPAHSSSPSPSNSLHRCSLRTMFVPTSCWGARETRCLFFHCV